MSVTDIDRKVGRNIRRRRRNADMTMAQLAKSIGLSADQVRKYERDINRVSAGMIYVIAEALGCRPEDLFEGLPGPSPTPGASSLNADFLAACSKLPKSTQVRLNALMADMAAGYAR